MTIFKFRKRLGNFLCTCGSHDFKMIGMLNSRNSHVKGHENIELLGDGHMPLDFEHKKCKRCGFEINEIKDFDLEPNNVQQ